LGQFATAQSNDDRADFKAKIVQRGAIGPLVHMLSNTDPQLQEMAAFALGRLAQHPDNQAGIMAMGALPKLLDLLRSSQHNLQHNAAFALYGLSENEDNLLHFVVGGSFQTIQAAELGPQASRDCIQKMTKRLQEKLSGKILGQVLYLMQTPTSDGAETRRSVATALGMLCTNEMPAQDICLAMIERGALGIIVDAVCEPELAETAHKEAALAFHTVATAVGTADAIKIIAAPIAPAEPGGVKLSPNYINNKLLSDVTFIVEGREYHAHRIALLASSEIFRSMFDGNGNFREAQGGSIPIPNIRWEAFHAMMTCIYTGTVEVLPEMAQELLAAADQYMLDTLKRLCEAAIAGQLTAENVWAAYELAENYNAPELAKHCALFCLKNYEEVADAHYEALVNDEGCKFDFAGQGTAGSRQTGFAHLMKKMSGRLKEAVEADMVKRTQSPVPEDDQMMVFD
jgi:BTB/POZ domain/Armadillo/beta-catenin-like repeat